MWSLPWPFQPPCRLPLQKLPRSLCSVQGPFQPPAFLLRSAAAWLQPMLFLTVSETAVCPPQNLHRPLCSVQGPFQPPALSPTFRDYRLASANACSYGFRDCPLSPSKPPHASAASRGLSSHQLCLLRSETAAWLRPMLFLTVSETVVFFSKPPQAPLQRPGAFPATSFVSYVPRLPCLFLYTVSETAVCPPQNPLQAPLQRPGAFPATSVPRLPPGFGQCFFLRFPRVPSAPLKTFPGPTAPSCGLSSHQL